MGKCSKYKVHLWHRFYQYVCSVTVCYRLPDTIKDAKVNTTQLFQNLACRDFEISISVFFLQPHKPR